MVVFCLDVIETEFFVLLEGPFVAFDTEPWVFVGKVEVLKLRARGNLRLITFRKRKLFRKSANYFYLSKYVPKLCQYNV